VDIMDTIWIPTAQKLPTFDTKVLVAHKYSGEIEIRYISKDRPNSWYPGGSSLGWYSYWMPLPEIPENLKTEISARDKQAMENFMAIIDTNLRMQS
jgi:hypothetical protein